MVAMVLLTTKINIKAVKCMPSKLQIPCFIFTAKQILNDEIGSLKRSLRLGMSRCWTSRPLQGHRTQNSRPLAKTRITRPLSSHRPTYYDAPSPNLTNLSCSFLLLTRKGMWPTLYATPIGTLYAPNQPRHCILRPLFPQQICRSAGVA